MLIKQQREKLRETAEAWPVNKPNIEPSNSKWFDERHIAVFNELFENYISGVYLELGSWAGAGSTRFVLSNQPKWDVIAVDTFAGSAGHQFNNELKAIAANLWDHFCVNVWEDRHRVFPLRMDTVAGMQALADIGVHPDIIYIDAAHDKQSVYSDILTAMVCFPNAMIAGDDYAPADSNGYPGVRWGIEQAIIDDLIDKNEFRHQQQLWYLTRNNGPVSGNAPYKDRMIVYREGLKNKSAAMKLRRPLPAPKLNLKTTNSIYDCDVVIPYCLNNIRWLTASVDSILNQVEVNCLVHLIADGFEVKDDPALGYADHPHVRLYRNDTKSPPIGPYRTMNRIFDRLETEFVAIQDSDDIALPHRITHSLKALKLNDVYGGSMRQFVSHEAKDESVLNLLRRTPIHTSGHSKWRLCPEGNIINGTMVLRRVAYQKINGFADLMGSGDLEFATRCHRAGLRVFTDNEIVGLRRLHSDSLSHGLTHGSKTKSRLDAHRKIEGMFTQMVPGCDFRQFGNLNCERFNHHELKPIGNLIEMKNLELHVSHACDLTCQQCSHYSDQQHKGVISVEEADKQLGLWSGRLLPRYFSLLGGEPTLNTNLCEIVEVARRHWPHSILQIVTNGFNLFRHPRLPQVMEDTGTRLEISIHHDSAEYTKRLVPVRDLIRQWSNTYTLKINWRSSSSRWTRTYKGYGPEMMPYEDKQPEKSWKICCAKWCPQIHDGKLWKCPQISYLPLQAAKFDLDPAWDPYLKYRPLEPDCTHEQLREFVSRNVESCCNMCPASIEEFNLPSPLRVLTR